MKFAAMDSNYLFELKTSKENFKKIKEDPVALEQVRERLERENDVKLDPKTFTIESLEGKHICKYCYGIADGPDEDVLCKECREVFGHAFYSEL